MRLQIFGILAIFLGVAACSNEAPPADSTGGGGTVGTGDTTTSSGTAGGAAVGGCPATLPEGACTQEGLACEYPTSPCGVTAWCTPSYEVDGYGELRWQHTAPSAGTACANPGELCKQANAVFDSETIYEAALCTADGWLIDKALCGNGHCGDCPFELPTEGSACDPGPFDDKTYRHCMYAAEKPCGPVIASLNCNAGVFEVSTIGCE